jgi:hypothetical protein
MRRVTLPVPKERIDPNRFPKGSIPGGIRHERKSRPEFLVDTHIIPSPVRLQRIHDLQEVTKESGQWGNSCAGREGGLVLRRSAVNRRQGTDLCKGGHHWVTLSPINCRLEIRTQNQDGVTSFPRTLWNFEGEPAKGTPLEKPLSQIQAGFACHWEFRVVPPSNRCSVGSD